MPDSRCQFHCRIGIATGHVVVDQPGIHGVGRSVMAFGATPTLAARLQQSADPGSILIDDTTMKLCEGRFTFRSIGSEHLKGFEGDHQVWEVVESLRPGLRFLLSGLSPYVGRGRGDTVAGEPMAVGVAGEGQVVVLHGEPGMGKSRLVYELQRSLPRNSGFIFQFQCLNQFSSTPIHPWIHSVQRFANILQNDTVDDQLAKPKDYLGRRLGFADEIVAICANLMGLVPPIGACGGPFSTAPDKAPGRSGRLPLSDVAKGAAVSSGRRHAVDRCLDNEPAAVSDRGHGYGKNTAVHNVPIRETCRRSTIPMSRVYRSPNWTAVP